MLPPAKRLRFRVGLEPDRSPSILLLSVVSLPDSPVARPDNTSAVVRGVLEEVEDVLRRRRRLGGGDNAPCDDCGKDGVTLLWSGNNTASRIEDDVSERPVVASWVGVCVASG